MTKRIASVAAVEGDALLRSRVDAIYAIMPTMIAMDLLGAIMVASYLWDSPSGAWLKPWFGAAVMLAIPRSLVALSYLRKHFRTVPTRVWGHLATGFAGAAGLLWALAVGWAMAVGTDNQVMFVICVALSGVTLSIANVTYWPVYAVFAGPVTAAAAMGCAWSDGPGRKLLAVGAASLTVALLVTSRSLSRQILRAHRLALTNHALVQSLADRGHELERAFAALQHLSSTDPLTSLANRRSRDERLEAEWLRTMRAEVPLTVIAIDVDHFKRYNDTHGHEEGDRCLRAVGEMLRTGVRGGVDLAARHGGEEFMLILPGIGEDAAISVAERIRVMIATCHEPYGLPQKVTVSLGIATVRPAPDRSVRELTMLADAALYRAKLAGRNRYEMAETGQNRALVA